MGSKRGQGEWSFSKRKDGLWTARKQFGWKENGKQNIKAFYGKSKPEVKEKAKEYELSLATGKASADYSKMTFEEYFSRWMKRYKQRNVKATTYDALEFTFENRIKPYTVLSQAQMHQINTAILQEYINELADSGKYSHTTIKKTFNAVNNCLKKAKTLGDIKENPMDGVELPSEANLNIKTKTIEFLDDEDIEKLVSESNRKRGGKEYKTAKYYHSKNADYYKYGHHIIFMLFTGLRVGEAIALRWSDVDFNGRSINVHRNVSVVYDRDDDGNRLSTKMNEGSTKTEGSTRYVPISEVAFQKLKEIKQNSVKCSDDDLVFSTSSGGYVSPRNLRRTLNTMQVNANTKVQNSGLHVLRHSFASMLIRRGIDVKVVSELLGHKKVNTTYDIYVSLIKQQKINAIQVLDVFEA